MQFYKLQNYIEPLKLPSSVNTFDELSSFISELEEEYLKKLPRNRVHFLVLEMVGNWLWVKARRPFFRLWPGFLEAVPTDEHPVETVVVADKNRSSHADVFDPFLEFKHHLFRIVEGKRLFSRKTGHFQCFGVKSIRDWLEFSVKRLVKILVHYNGTKGDHRIITGNWTVALNVHHYVTHLFFLLPQKFYCSFILPP